MKDVSDPVVSAIRKVKADPHVAMDQAAKHGVVHVVGGLEDAIESPASLIGFLRQMGKIIFTDGETPAPGFPELNIVTNSGRNTKPKSVFHSDTTYVERPPSYSALIAIEVPEQGGATLFTDQYRALETLDTSLRILLDGALVLHGPTDVPETDAFWHPLIRRNPETQRDALFLTSLARCQKLQLRNGMDRSDLLPILYHHSQTFEQPRRHTWSSGDILIWDNRCTLHAADHSAVVGTRTLYRGLIEGEQPAMG